MSETLSDEELLPCPFCGDPDPDLLGGGPPGNWFVICPNCKATTNDVGGLEEAMALWNRRPAPSPAPAQKTEGQP